MSSGTCLPDRVLSCLCSEMEHIAAGALFSTTLLTTRTESLTSVVSLTFNSMNGFKVDQ